MRTILFIIQKEFKQIFRNKAMLPILFILPLIQLLILSNAATFEVKNIKIGFIDRDQSVLSRELINKFNTSEYFKIYQFYNNQGDAKTAMQKGNIAVIFEIPNNFEKNLIRENKTDISVQIDAINGASAGVANGYINQIVRDFNKSVILKYGKINNLDSENKTINIIPEYWFNPELNYKFFMVPGIIVILVTMISFFLSGMNIVREKEIGTLEQINVTPIKKHQFIIGKLFPFWVLGLFILFFAMNIGRILFHVPIVGDKIVILAFASIYILVFLGMGFFISNFTETQQQAMFIAWFFTVIFMLMSGLFTPIESMPYWAQRITDYNPIRYFIEVIRMVMLKGSSFNDVIPQFVKIFLFAIAMNLFAVLSYKKTN
jgi:ABC-2 type transport system permease protein